jgi:hypothetical protein
MVCGEERRTGLRLDSDGILSTTRNPTMIANLPNLRLPLPMEKIARFVVAGTEPG